MIPFIGLIILKSPKMGITLYSFLMKVFQYLKIYLKVNKLIN
jgi:hypothetical protein